MKQVFILSDFICPDFQESLRIAGRKHDVAALQIFDKRETEIPAVGLARFTDPESGQSQWVDTSLKSVRKEYSSKWNDHNENLHTLFSKTGTDYVTVDTSEDYVKPLKALFKKR